MQSCIWFGHWGWANSWSGALLILGGCMALLLGGLGKISRGVGDNQGIVAGFVVLRGDFNVIRFLGERNSISRLSLAMRRFLEIIEHLELRDLP
ncbi:hypothetical protein CK203_100787 [Vitis vinifera]|uniref:Uncharacterized protein n=1 Tax=Vitis vinifera TaxID=29760 RepID=A0A438CJG0_VITVI|nr:hypothetical protein CK203_100787 [Vitis vinifera]